MSVTAHVGLSSWCLYILQDIIKTFFPSGLLKEFGSLLHLSESNQLLLQKCEKSDYSATCIFLELVAHSYTVTLAENKLVEVTGSRNSLFAGEKQRMLERISEEIVTDIWPKVDTASLDGVRQGLEPVRDGGNVMIF